MNDIEGYAQTFPQKIKTNFVSSDPEVAQMRKVLHEQIAALAQIDREISSICGDILQQRDEIKSYINGLETLLSPTRRIPVEILQKTFSFCLPVGRNAFMSADEAPLLLGTVCRQWRQVSISTPNLWDSIHIPVVYHRHPPLSADESRKISLSLNEAVKRWLDRSGTCSLSISVAEIRVGLGEGPDYMVNDPGASLFEILARVSRRWRNIEFTGTSLLPLFTALTQEDVPLLESFSVKASSFSSRSSDGSASTMFHAPRLHTLRLLDMSGRILDYQVPWSSLTELCIEGHGIAAGRITESAIRSHVALTLLGRCRNLVRCRLDITAFHPTDAQYRSGELIVLPFLADFRINETGISLVGFYKSLRTPALKRFEFVSERVPPSGIFPACSLLSRSSLLETLTIIPNSLTHQHVVSCLLSAPSITTLILKPEETNRIIVAADGSLRAQEPVVNDKLLAFITPSPSVTKACPCPLLQHIEFGFINSITDETLLTFIKARTKFGNGPINQPRTGVMGAFRHFIESRIQLNNKSMGQLRSVTGGFSRPWTLNLMAHLSSEIAEGLKVDLRYSGEKTVSPSTGVQWMDGKEKGHTSYCRCRYC